MLNFSALWGCFLWSGRDGVHTVSTIAIVIEMIRFIPPSFFVLFHWVEFEL